MSELKTPAEWCLIERVEIMDPDGWRGRGGRPWTDPITLAEFKQRLVTCTMRHVVGTSADDREPFRNARDAGLRARHETRLAAKNPMACVFCTRISRGEYDKQEPGFSFEPLNPVVRGHRLFVTPQHVVDASQDPEAAARAFSYAAEYARRQGTDFNLITSGGSYATQSVMHVHIHYVPREDGDGLSLPWMDQRKADRRGPASRPCKPGCEFVAPHPSHPCGQYTRERP